MANMVINVVTADAPGMQATDGVRRVSELQKEVAHCKHQLHANKLAAQQSTDSLTQLQV